MKKSSIAVLLVSFGAISITGMSSQDIQLTIAQAQPAALAKDRLFQDRIPAATFEKWHKAVAAVEKYTETNGKGDSILMKAMDKVKQANDKLINTLKITYNTSFSKPGVSGSDKNRIELTMDFKDIETNMKKVQKDLESERFFYTGKQKSQALILALAQAIEAVATKAMKDIEKEIRARR